ncbi:MAG: hypothetical protein ACERKN_03275 [Velocimicrobium sp.]
MVVAFYSPLHGQAGTSSNLLSIAISLVLNYQKKLFLMESHFEKNGLESMVIKKPKQVEQSFLEDFGIDLIARSKAMGELCEEQLNNASFSFLDNQLHLLPGTRQVNRDIFEQSIQPTILEVLELANQYYDMVFIDISSNRGELTNKLLERADLMVVNLSQNPCTIRTFFEETPVEKGKQIYILGNYDKNSRFNRINLSYMFPKLSIQNTVTISYNGLWRDASYEAEAISFMRKQFNANVRKKTDNYAKEIKKASLQIIRKAGGRHV